MNYTAISVASVVVLLAVIAVTAVDGYSPTSTKFDWSPNRNSQGRHSIDILDFRQLFGRIFGAMF